MDANLNLYKYFLAVMETGNVCAAAEKLGVSQPTVSYSIHALQRDLGEKLFVVGRQGIVPLPRALILYRRIQPVFTRIMQTLNGFMREKEKLQKIV